MKKAAVHNLGCKVNSYELDVMVQKLKEAGYEIVPFDEKADVYVINTCTVTNIADRKSRQMIHRAKKENPDAVVIAAGCYVETDPEEVKKDPCIDLAVGNNRKSEIAQILQEYLKNRKAGIEETKTLDGQTIDADLNAKPAFESMHLDRPGHTRAYIKIQDGCNQFCSYCIIPYARGRIRSRETDEIVEEVKGLAADGVKEVVLTGIHVSSFGKDRGEDPGTALLDLMQRIQLIAGIERIRFGSLEPRIMTEEFVRGMSRLSKVCPHFHLSLQSGCNATLHRMNRHYTAEEYAECVARLRTFFDRPAITTDVIVGFPGETDEEFSECVSFLEKIGFYEIHVFKYSVRHGTAAEKLPDQQTDETKTSRSRELLALTRKQAQAYREQFLGEKEELLLEEPVTVNGKQYFTGHTKRYVEGAVPMERCGGCAEGDLLSGTFEGLLPGTPYVLLMPDFVKD